MDEEIKKIGRVLRASRKEQGMTQEQLAESCGISPKCVGEIERGETNPSVGVIFKLTSALGKYPSHIFSVNPRLSRKTVYLDRLTELLKDKEDATRNLAEAIESLVVNGKKA